MKIELLNTVEQRVLRGMDMWRMDENRMIRTVLMVEVSEGQVLGIILGWVDGEKVALCSIGMKVKAVR